MSIDFETETVISLSEATRLLPRRREGKRPHVATIYRWAQRGLRGVHLETIQIGGTQCTSIEALQRFFDSLTVHADSGNSPREPSRVRQIENAEKELAEEGF